MTPENKGGSVFGRHRCYSSADKRSIIPARRRRFNRPNLEKQERLNSQCTNHLDFG